MFAENTQDLQFCERAFMVIRFVIVFSQTLHETTDRYIKLRNDRHFANYYHVTIYRHHHHHVHEVLRVFPFP
jgi:uncharacterized protein YjlB